MCGICGVAYTDPAREVERGVLGAMNDAIRHRGPDSDGFHIAPGVGLAARRLAIIDLITGDQPLENEDDTVHVVFNGEIYNHRDLREQLRARGHVLRTSVDTEVIVHLYEEYGADCVQHLRGMFAFALWDDARGQLLLARDRVGKKPLYYTQDERGIIFGSELKCVLTHPGVSRRVDARALHHYLTLQYVPDPLSAFAGISKLPPGHTLTWTRTSCTTRRYWDLSYEPKLEGSDSELLRSVRDTVSDAVQVRLMSDVPLGAHLSGGVDSSIVVGVMSQLLDIPVRTFAVGFREDAFSELSHARTVAQHFGTEHHELMVTPDALDVLPRLVEHFDEPFADPAAIPLWYLSEFTRQHVTVALNGDGGDEAFAGYQRYFADPVADAYRAVPALVRNRAVDPLLSRIPARTDKPVERSYTTAMRLLARAAKLSHAASVVRWGSYFDEAEKAALYTDDMAAVAGDETSASLLERTFARTQARHRIDRTLYTDLHNYLPGALLVKADRMTMAHSLEARSPLLDHHVLELAARLPVRWKVKGRVTKRALRAAFADMLPADIARRGKMGFGVPLGAWFRGPLHGAARDMLLAPSARIAEYLRPAGIAALLEQNRRGEADHGKRLWALLNLEAWLRRFSPEAPWR
jgi:asparagine synthase (glutamine-hydrolysing)